MKNYKIKCSRCNKEYDSDGIYGCPACIKETGDCLAGTFDSIENRNARSQDPARIKERSKG